MQYGLFTVTAWMISNTDSPTPRYLSARDRMLGSFIREVSGLRIVGISYVWKKCGSLTQIHWTS